MAHEYQLKYLPLFYDDLSQVVTYISEKLHNPKAARDLLDETEKVIRERLPVAESFEPYHSVNDRKYPYYRIYVGNYVVYYVVCADASGNRTMEIRRFLYGGSDREKMI